MSNKKKKPAKKSKSTKVQAFDILQVRWEDHFSGNHQWGNANELRTKPMICMTVGHLVHEDKKTITLAMNMGESLHVADTTTVLKNCIVSRKVLGTIHYDKS